MYFHSLWNVQTTRLYTSFWAAAIAITFICIKIRLNTSAGSNSNGISLNERNNEIKNFAQHRKCLVFFLAELIDFFSLLQQKFVRGKTHIFILDIWPTFNWKFAIFSNQPIPWVISNSIFINVNLSQVVIYSICKNSISSYFTSANQEHLLHHRSFASQMWYTICWNGLLFIIIQYLHFFYYPKKACKSETIRNQLELQGHTLQKKRPDLVKYLSLLPCYMFVLPYS